MEVYFAYYVGYRVFNLEACFTNPPHQQADQGSVPAFRFTEDVNVPHCDLTSKQDLFESSNGGSTPNDANLDKLNQDRILINKVITYCTVSTTRAWLHSLSPQAGMLTR